jgi:small conductance mechanosensitive channel
VLAFALFEVPNYLGNTLLQLIILYYGTRIAISIVRPSMRKIDSRINRIHRREKQAYELEHNSKMIETLVTYAISAVALVIALSILGYTDVLTAALASAGIVGIVIGFAAKDVVANTLAGVSIAFDRPLMYGETVEISGNKGKVEEIGLRMLKLKTFDNKIIMIPNSLVTSGAVINYTRKNTRRLDVPISIAYEADLQKAVSVLEKIPPTLPGVITGSEAKPMQIILSNFGNSSIDLTVRFWVNIRKTDLFVVEVEARKKILQALNENGIEIPYQKMVILPPSNSGGKQPKKAHKKN